MPHAITIRGRAEIVRQAIEQLERQLEYFEINQLLAEKADDEQFPGGDENHTYATERAGFHTKISELTKRYKHLMPAVESIRRLQESREEKTAEAELAELDKQNAAADPSADVDADAPAAAVDTADPTDAATDDTDIKNDRHRPKTAKP